MVKMSPIKTTNPIKTPTAVSKVTIANMTTMTTMTTIANMTSCQMTPANMTMTCFPNLPRSILKT
eukprot:5146101-Karenia_brevis.AAC.1